MPSGMKGPGLFVAQFAGPAPPFSSLPGLAGWAKGLGYKALQVPLHDPRLLDLPRAAESPDHAQEVLGGMEGLALSELAAQRLRFQLARHPAYALADASPPGADPSAWSAERLRLAARACRNLGVARIAAFSGALAWPYAHPWPLREEGLIAEAFAELGRRWRPILDAFDAAGVDVCFEPHPGCDVHDGVTFERFLDAVGGHPRCRLLYDPSHMVLQCMDPVGFVEAYGPLIRAFHVKDAEFRRSGRSGAFGGFQPWLDRPGRYRTPGDGDVPWAAVFAALARTGYDGWAVLEWEDPLRRAEDGARQGAELIRRHMIRPPERDFDASLLRGLPPEALRGALGLPGDAPR